MLLVALLLACKSPQDLTVTPRDALDRTPITTACSDLDPTRCLLPWPSSSFMVADASTETGVRVRVAQSSLPVADSLVWLNRSDGFSRATGVAAAFQDVDPDAISWDPADSLSADSTLQVLVAQADLPSYGMRVAFRTEVVDVSTIDRSRQLVIGRPLQVLAPNADHVVVILDKVGDVSAPRAVKVALGLLPPETTEEAGLAGYHAPTVALLESSGVELDRVVRVWDFTSRSATDATWRMHHMIDALDDAIDDIDVVFDDVIFNPAPELAGILRGRLTGAPSFLTDDGHLAVDDNGAPKIVGTTSIEFRMSVPLNDEPSYHVALYGHGTGGDVTDSAFDRELAAQNIAKLNLRFDGWTGEDFVYTLTNFATFLDGSERSTAGLMQALAGGTVLLTALDGVLGDALTGPTLAGEVNPAAGKLPDTSEVAWVGGSMGGTMGAVIVSADPRLQTAVLNVPGAGWTHMIPHSLLYNSGMGSIMAQVYVDPLDLQLAMVMAQNDWDDVDGAVWADEALAVGGSFLLQESMDDPVLPNVGTDLLASALGAVQIQPTLQDIVDLEQTDGKVRRGASLTQFRVPNTGQYDVHGFAARNTPAADAAMEQILQLLTSAWAGSPEMSFPDGCAEVTAGGDCDFSGMWDER